MTEEERERLYHETLMCEKLVDENLEKGIITIEQSWEGYFLIMHELERFGFSNHHYRILSKIDIKQFHPLRSDFKLITSIAEQRIKSSPKGDPFDIYKPYGIN